MKLYKVLNTDGSCCHGGIGKWPLPHGSQPGKWLPKITDDLAVCKCGYHVLKPENLIDWLGPMICEVEVRGTPLWDGNKGVVRQARIVRVLETWDERTARLLACDYAAHVLSLWQQSYPDDNRVQQTIAVARRLSVPPPRRPMRKSTLFAPLVCA